MAAVDPLTSGVVCGTAQLSGRGVVGLFSTGILDADLKVQGHGIAVQVDLLGGLEGCGEPIARP